MADRHVVFKQCLKEIAEAHGHERHLHGEVRRGRRRLELPHPLQPVARREERVSRQEDAGPIECSDAFRWFLGGWIAHVPEVMVFYAPTVNSYKRYVDGSWAPTRLAWSYDNRTAGFRVVGAGQSLRIECRIPGADCNPYLAFAASLASGLDGIANRIEPPEIFDGDIYAARDLPRVPYTLREATELFEQERVREARLRRGRRRALRSLLPHRAARVRQGGDRLGTQRYFERI